MAFDLEMIKAVYAGMEERVSAARQVVGRPLTLTEKILYAHLFDGKFAKATSVIVSSSIMPIYDSTSLIPQSSTK